MEWRRRADQQHKRQLWGKVSDEAPGEENTQENATESRGLGTPEEDSKSIRRDKLYQKKFCLWFKKIWGGGGELSEFSESRKISRNQLQEIIWRGFPGGSVVKKKKNNAQCRRHSFCPRSGKIPHAVEQLSLHAATAEARRACSETREAAAMRSLHAARKSNSHSQHLEKNPHSRKTQHNHKLIN